MAKGALLGAGSVVDGLVAAESEWSSQLRAGAD